MNMDAELETWRSDWQSQTVVPPDLRRKVERQSRFMRIALLADILVTVVIGGGAIALAVRNPKVEFLVLAAATWIFLAAAWMFAIKMNRGNWSPSALDTAAFVDLSVRRCRGRLAAIRFGAILFVTEMVFCLSWLYRNGYAARPLLEWLLFGSVAIDAVWVCTVVFFGFLVWYGRRKRAELAWLIDLREQTRQPGLVGQAD